MIRQKISNFRLLIFLPALILAGAFCIFLSGSAHADDDRPAYRLQISPIYDKIGTVYPGDTYTGKFNVQNTGTEAYEYATDIHPFSVKGEDYDQDFDTASDYSVMTDWVTLSGATGLVQPGTESAISYTIHIPEDAPAGLQSIALIVTMINTDKMQSSGIQTISRAAFPILLNVDGETRTTGEIIKNTIPAIVFTPPLVTTSVVRNTGNIYTEAEYRLEITNFFSGDIAYSNTHYENGEEYGETLVIMPESERYNEVAWEKAPAVGLFKVKQTIRIFDEESVAEKLVILCPLWLLFIILVFIAVAVYWIVSRIIGRKSR